METGVQTSRSQILPGYRFAPIHPGPEDAPLSICVVVRPGDQPASDPFVLLRELPGSRIYLGALCDAAGSIQEWLELWVQHLELSDLPSGGYQERLTNHAFDQRWRSEYARLSDSLPHRHIATGMEENNPGPVLIRNAPARAGSPFLAAQPAPWRICKDDALLQSVELAPYTSSPFRYLYATDGAGAKTFLATSADAPANPQVRPMAALNEAPGTLAVFNPLAGLIRVARFTPLELDDYLQILEGKAWPSTAFDGVSLAPKSVYGSLQTWSASPKGLPFLLHSRAGRDSLNEVFYLKLCALRDLFLEVRQCVKSQQAPLLNLTPASFRVFVPDVGDPFPALWAARCLLAKPGQAYPVQLSLTEQKYFLRLGRVEPSPFLPEGLGGHAFGIGSVRIRNVTSETDGLVLEGTLVADDYLRADPQDLLWFTLPLAEERLEFFARIRTSEAAGPKEARFRTLPVKLGESMSASLKKFAGTGFGKSPYELWPLLSSPCDLFSLGVVAVRVLLANGQSNLPEILDEVLSLARQVEKHVKDEGGFLPGMQALIKGDPHFLELVGPHKLVDSGHSPQEAWAKIQSELWLETVGLILRLFPGSGSHGFCKDFGDVSPLALETVLDRPLQELETLVLRARSVLTPSLSANEEIASLILAQLENHPD
jgi:hypothetical protein